MRQRTMLLQRNYGQRGRRGIRVQEELYMNRTLKQERRARISPQNAWESTVMVSLKRARTSAEAKLSAMLLFAMTLMVMLRIKDEV